MSTNTLIRTDVYKMGHMEQYPEDTEFVYSYLEARKPNQKIVWFGLQYYLMKYLSTPVNKADVDTFLRLYKRILGKPAPDKTVEKLRALQDLGYWPLLIKSPHEGSLYDSQNILMSIRNTVPGFHWCVGLLESLLMKVWNSCTVATASYSYRKLIEEFADKTCDNRDHVPYAVHEFGYRGGSSEGTAAISGAAHLLSFLGTDNVPAVNLMEEYYSPDSPDTIIGCSVPATEHSVMCSYGREGELEAFRHLITEVYPTGIVSVVSDTYDLWNVLENFTEELKDEILNRDGKVVFRPDSGNPELIICGNPGYAPGSPEAKGALQILWAKFGGTTNSKGYKVLNPKVGLIYGDGMVYERFRDILIGMEKLGFASSNLVIGVGGILIQNHSRDEFGFALKATQVVRSGKAIDIYKDPITDPGKRSKKGLMQLVLNDDGTYTTLDQVSEWRETQGQLMTTFRNGRIKHWYTIEDLRKNLRASEILRGQA
jgi:nicotinamide phosphoribosyltransferase